MELQEFVDRISREKDEIAIHNEAIKGIVAEAKEAGIVPKHLRQIVRESRLESDVRDDHLATLDRMRRELGWLAGTPLGEAAMSAEAGKVADWPRPFAEQRVLERRKTPVARKRGRPRKVLFDQEHPFGTA